MATRYRRTYKRQKGADRGNYASSKQNDWDKQMSRNAAKANENAEKVEGVNICFKTIQGGGCCASYVSMCEYFFDHVTDSNDSFSLFILLFLDHYLNRTRRTTCSTHPLDTLGLKRVRQRLGGCLIRVL